MTYRAVLSEPTIVLPSSSDIGIDSAAGSGLGDESQKQVNEHPPAKRPRESDNSRHDTVADSETGSKKKKKKKRIKGEINS